jgi:hypothetical protein
MSEQITGRDNDPAARELSRSIRNKLTSSHILSNESFQPYSANPNSFNLRGLQRGMPWGCQRAQAIVLVAFLSMGKAERFSTAQI